MRVLLAPDVSRETKPWKANECHDEGFLRSATALWGKKRSYVFSAEHPAPIDIWTLDYRSPTLLKSRPNGDPEKLRQQSRERLIPRLRF